jgi:small subunit ribosomal protein S20
MANIKSAIKRIKTSEKRRLQNKNRVSRIRTFIKKVETALATGDATVAQTALRELQPEIARGSVKGAMHKNTAARTLSRLSSKIKALGTQKAA